jgi:anti-sigma factor RsiW
VTSRAASERGAQPPATSRQRSRGALPTISSAAAGGRRQPKSGHVRVGPTAIFQPDPVGGQSATLKTNLRARWCEYVSTCTKRWEAWRTPGIINLEQGEQMALDDESQLSRAELAELSALADGSLDPSRRDAVEAWIRTSPHLVSLYERERAAVELLQRATAERAPARLRVQIQTQRRRPAVAAPRRAGFAGLAGALAAAAIVLALALPGGTPGAPSVSRAALLALRGASAPAPGLDAADPTVKLAERLQGVYFPNYSGTLGWRAVGLRRDRLGGRPTVTVYYQRQNQRVAYTVVGAPVLSQPSAPVQHRNGVAMRLLSVRGRSVVTWQRNGQTCVLSAAGVPTSSLEQLAAWRSGLTE